MKKTEEVIFYTIDKSIKTYRQYAQKKLTEGGHNITIDQWLVLSVIHDNQNINQIEISTKVFKDTASVTRIIELLVKLGLIKRAILTNDRRRTDLKLTSKGEKILEDVGKVILNNRKNALKRISKDELILLNTLLNKIIDNCHD